MNQKQFLAITLLLIGTVVAGAAQAVPILPNQWYEFRSFAGGATGACAGTCTAVPGTIEVGDPAWTFSGSGVFEVNDGFSLIDQFEVFDFGVSLGVTSAPGGGSCGASLAGCLVDPDASRGSFVLGAGNHSITITNLLEDGGAHFFRFSSRDATVPAPASLALVMLGLAGLGRRRAA